MRERRQVAHSAAALQAFVDALRDRAHGDAQTVALGSRYRAARWSNGSWSAGLPSMPSIRSSWIGFGIASRRRAQRRPSGRAGARGLVADRPQAFRLVRLDHPLIVQVREWSGSMRTSGLSSRG